MKMMIMKMMMMTVSLIPILKNPMSMGIILLMQTMLMTLLMNKILQSAWFPMITFLMMIGGLLILFTYMSSLASNEKFKLKINLTLIIIFIMIMSEELMNESQINEKESLMCLNQESFSMIKLYNKSSMLLTMMLVLYLLLTMIVSTKIVKHHEGPLRSKTYE